MYRTPTMVAPWPWTKFEKNLEAADLDKQKPAVLVASGSFSLCHAGHVQMLHKARWCTCTYACPRCPARHPEPTLPRIVTCGGPE